MKTNPTENVLSTRVTGEIAGLPALPPGSLAALIENGTVIAIAAGDLLTTYHIASGCNATERECYRLAGRGSAIAESNLGIVIAVEAGETNQLVLARDGRLTPVCALPGTATALVAAGAQAFVVARNGAERQGRLLQVDLRQREVVAERALDHAQMRLAIDGGGSQLVLSDPRVRKVQLLDATGGLCLVPNTSPSPRQPESGPRHNYEAPHNRGCCCTVCVPIPKCGESRPASPPPTQDPTRPPESSTPSQNQPPPGHDCSGHDGQAGVPAPGGGTVVGNGTNVDHRPPAGTDRGPCGRNLFWKVEALQRASGYFIASDRAAQNVALLSADINLLEEWKFGRGGARVLSAEATTAAVMYLHSSRQWLKYDVHELASAHLGLGKYVVESEESKTFIGQKLYTRSYGQGGAPSSINAVLLPIIEGDQVYSSSDLAGFGAFIHRAMEPVVRDFYQENSFGILKDVNIKVFGVDVGPIGLPLQLPRKKLTDYYFPTYVPAAAVLTRTGVKPGDRLVFDGRESLSLAVNPLSGGGAGDTVVLPFFALAFHLTVEFFPFQVKFLGTEKFTMAITAPSGAAKTLVLAFTAKTIDMPDLASLPGKLTELKTYLDGVMKAAEVAAGISPRLFASPSVVRVPEIGKDFGQLLVTFAAATLTGPHLIINSAVGAAPGGDPIGVTTAILGTIDYTYTVPLQDYLQICALLGQEANPKYGYNNRILNPPTCAFDGGAAKLTTMMPIADRYGGPGAKVTASASSGLDLLFNAVSVQENSATTLNDEHAPKDFDDLLRDAFSAAIERLRANGRPTDALNSFGTILLMPVEPPTAKFGVLPAENWNVAPLFRPFYLRGEEWPGTVIDRKDASIQAQTTWALVFMRTDSDDLNTSVVCHEQGHAVGFGDLYKQVGYRDELAYMDDWAIMATDSSMSHHCGYHKLQANWIPDGAGVMTDYGRVYPFGLPLPSTARTEEVLLVALELWRDSFPASARAAFGVGNDFPVVQLVHVDLGGDGATFGLIEAREHAKNSGGHVHFNQKLPGDGGILITNAIAYKLDERFAVNNFYRRNLQLLNPDNILRNPGDKFDLAFAPEFPVKGMKVEVIDRKTIEGDAEVYRIKISRENAEFVDLYFDQGDPYYKSPDLWVDWWGNNKPKPEDLSPDYPLGQPTDQGETIFVPNSGAEPHWLVARVRNRGQVEARDVKVNFFYMEPPGGGDGKKPLNTKTRTGLKFVGTATKVSVPGGNIPVKIPVRWDVPAGFGGHTCILVEIEDSKVPRDAKGAALGTGDQWDVNNHAQKNVDKFQALSASPFEPIGFDFSVYNSGLTPEIAYLEPEALPYGMKLTVTPPVRKIAAGETVLYHCKLELDERIIRSGCENDQRFRLYAWRKDPESSARWGGVEYEVQPRLKTAVTLTGTWDSAQLVELKGAVVPNPGGGTLRIRFAFEKQQSHWEVVPLTAAGTFAWSGLAPAGNFSLEAAAAFEGNRKYGAARSAPLHLSPPPIVR